MESHIIRCIRKMRAACKIILPSYAIIIKSISCVNPHNYAKLYIVASLLPLFFLFTITSVSHKMPKKVVFPTQTSLNIFLFNIRFWKFVYLFWKFLLHSFAMKAEVTFSFLEKNMLICDILENYIRQLCLYSLSYCRLQPVHGWRHISQVTLTQCHRVCHRKPQRPHSWIWHTSNTGAPRTYLVRIYHNHLKLRLNRDHRRVLELWQIIT